LSPPYYRGCWHGVSRDFLCGYRQARSSYSPCVSSPLTGFYTPKCVIIHAALLRQTFVHCAIFPTAASRRSLGRISVPVWPFTLSGRLPIAALVGRYPANKLMGRGSIYNRQVAPSLIPKRCRFGMLSGIKPPFEGLFQSYRQVIHVVLTRSPLYSPNRSQVFSFDLHVLGTPPAFVLSQDQTLRKYKIYPSSIP
jgi:hypothetical protein